jgi:tetratricopeptide (TPR) repeat protein
MIDAPGQMPMDQPLASRLAREGFELWEQGRLVEAAAKYVQALENVDPAHYALPDYHGEYAGVLAALGRDEEARMQYERSLALSLRDDPEALGAAVAVAGYFLAELLLKMNLPADALEVIHRYRALESRSGWPLRVVEAQCLWRLGRTRQALDVAKIVVLTAPSPERAAEMRELLAEILRPEES